MTTPNVYDKVKHMMIPIREITPEHEAWISLVADIVATFTKDILGDDEELHIMNSFTIHTAADVIWDTTKGHPCWSRLDVHEYMRLHAESPLWSDVQQACVVATMVTFYNWLADTKRLRRGKAHRIVRRFGPYFNDDLMGAVFGPTATVKSKRDFALN